MDGFTTDLRGHMQTSEGDPRTGTFHRTRVTPGDTACNVNGVLATFTGYLMYIVTVKAVTEVLVFKCQL